MLVDRQQLPPVHAAAVPGRELPAEPGRHRRAAAQGVPRCPQHPVPDGRRRRHRLRGKGRPPRRRRHAAVRPRSCSQPAVARTSSATTTIARSRARAQGSRRSAPAAQPRARAASNARRATDDADERRRLLTFCIVGGGPTGVEYAGALGELVRLVLPQRVPRARARLECASCCSKAATGCCRCSSPGCRGTRGRELERRGVDVRCNALVAEATDKLRADARTAREIETASMIWTAGVKPSRARR